MKKGTKHSTQTKLKMKSSWSYEKHITESFKVKQKSRMIGNTNTLGFIPTLESRLKMRNARLGKKGSNEMRDKMRKIRLTRVMPQKDSKPEKIIQLNLKLIGIDFEKHKPISGQPDIFIQPNICIFIDGCYWHVCKNQDCEIGKLNLIRELKEYQIDKMTNDLNVNHILKTEGYIIIRIWEHEIKNNLDMTFHNLKMNLKTLGVEIKSEK